MADRTGSLLDQFRSSVAATPPIPSPQLAGDNDNAPYQAYVEDRTGRAERLFIYFPGKPDNVGVYLLSHMTEIRSPNHQHLVMTFGTAAILVKGRNLTKLVRLMHEGKIHTLQPYHPERFSEPEEGDPVITFIQRTSLMDVQPAMENRAAAGW